MAFYESLFIVRQDLTPAQVEGLSTQFADIIKAQSGTVSKVEQIGLRRLAHRINKNRKGHYVLMNIDAPAPAIAEFERNMRLHEDVLRFLTLKVDALEEGPSAFLRKPKYERNEIEGEAA
jgi:small subunit ribosomal protein S6